MSPGISESVSDPHRYAVQTCSSSSPSSTSSFVMASESRPLTRVGVAHRDGVVPAAAARPAGRRAVFLPRLAQPLAHRTGEFGRQRARADARRVRLGHAEHGADRAGPMPRPVAAPPAVRIRRGDERIGAVVDVEQRALRALEHHRAAGRHRAMQIERRVGDERLQTRPDRAQIRQHVLPLHVRVAHEAVARGDVLVHRARERAVVARVREIADAHAAAADLVFVGRPDAARRRADLPLAPPRFRQHVQLAVIRQDEMRLVAHEQASGHVDAQPRQLIHLAEQRVRIDDDAVADEADDAGMEDPRRNQVKDELASADIHGVSRVVSALIARDDRKVRGQQIDDLPLALIAPLGADHAQIHAGSMIPLWPLPRETPERR